MSHETKAQRASLVKEIRQGRYTHIVTSPEQIAMEWFLELVPGAVTLSLYADVAISPIVHLVL